jgi:hypothetical protein
VSVTQLILEVILLLVFSVVVLRWLGRRLLPWLPIIIYVRGVKCDQCKKRKHPLWGRCKQVECPLDLGPKLTPKIR